MLLFLQYYLLHKVPKPWKRRYVKCLRPTLAVLQTRSVGMKVENLPACKSTFVVHLLTTAVIWILVQMMPQLYCYINDCDENSISRLKTILINCLWHMKQIGDPRPFLCSKGKDVYWSVRPYHFMCWSSWLPSTYQSVHPV